MKVGRITLSDRASSGVYEDLSGPEIERVVTLLLETEVHFVARLLPDEPDLLRKALMELCDVEGCELVLTTGGTGPTPRDITPETTRAILEKELPGFGEIMRAVSFARVPTAILSRAVAGIRGRTLIVNLPGNPKAISECLTPLVPAIRECLRHMDESER